MKDHPQSLLEWLRIEQPPQWARAKRFGKFCGFLLVLVSLAFLALFFCALVAAFVVVFHTVSSITDGSSSLNTLADNITSSDNKSPNLGAGALIAAALGAPLIIWGTILKHHALRYQKEGHITDRINKAVEQLGSVKVFEAIGRPLTILAGPSSITLLDTYEDAQDYVKGDGDGDNFRRYVGVKWDPGYQNDEGDLVKEPGDYHEVEVWSHEETIIEWEGQKNLLPSHRITKHGDWGTLKRTLPNVEVRVGAILSLERIAQDSVKFDKGRDHVRIMEILCAYLRENAATTAPFDEGSKPLRKMPRVDIQTAVDVIRRRSVEQLESEERAKYRPNLENCDLTSVNLSGASLRGALLSNSKLDYANLRKVDLSGACLHGVRYNFSDLVDTILTGADMSKSVCIWADYTSLTQIGARPDAYLKGLNIYQADLRWSLRELSATSLTFGCSDTKLNEKLNAERKLFVKALKKSNGSEVVLTRDEEDLLQNSPFRCWKIDYRGRELPNAKWLAWRQEIGLTGWPYDDD